MQNNNRDRCDIIEFDILILYTFGVDISEHNIIYTNLTKRDNFLVAGGPYSKTFSAVSEKPSIGVFDF